MSLLQNSNAISAGGAYNITDSVRFRESASAYLERTFTTPTNNKKWSLSVWLKRGKVDSYDGIFSSAVAGTGYSTIRFDSTGRLDFVQFNGTVNLVQLTTNALYRDPSAWYHVFVSVDTTQATASNRVKMYVNGELITSYLYSTYPSQNLDTYFNSATNHNVGRNVYSGSTDQPFDGYMTEVNFVDGQALTPSDFGETNADGVWSPKEYTGTYGTNGFYLPMKETTQATGFNTVLYTGSGATNHQISNVGFSPDLVWIKDRTSTNPPYIHDSVRGASFRLNTSDTAGDLGGLLSSFDSNGFTISSSGVGVNGSSNNYVSWCWDAGSSTVSNTDGTITSSVRANPASGFSIVTYTATGNGSDTVGHGLGTAPKVVLLKSRSTTGDWIYYTTQIDGSLDYLYLNQTVAKADSGWTVPSSTVFPPSNTTNGTTMVAYCFSEVAGFSKFGSYTGNGSTSGPTVTTGFRPAFVMIKRTDDVGNWIIHDNTRNPSNPVDGVISANLSNAESSLDTLNFTDTGFEIITNNVYRNASGGTYIYMAFADTRDYQWNFDASGNKNNWTPNNINSNASSETTYDLMSDVPSLADEDTGNFATLNPLYKDSVFVSSTYSNGNLNMLSGGTASNGVGSIGVSSGKYYWESVMTAIPTTTTLYVAFAGLPISSATIRAYRYDTGQYFNGSSWIAYGSTYTTNDVIGIALDMDSDTIEFFKNGVSQGQKTSIGLSGQTLFPFIYANANGGVAVNFGQRPFKYTPPTGYKKLNTYNLPDSSITDGSQYFAPVTYTGNGTSQDITMDFSPDFVWIKERSSTSSHRLYDTIRDVNNYLQSSSTDSEGTNAGNGLTVFNSDGFSVGSNTAVNESGISHISWSWRGSDSTAVSNTDGTITSTVSANTTSGFSIVSYTGNGTAGATVGHGLGVAPAVMIVKNRDDATSSWSVYHHENTAAPETDVLLLDLTNATNDNNLYWNDTAPDSSVFTVGTAVRTNNNNDRLIAYCFAEVEGFSKFGSYTGNGSTDGPFIYTGFRPAFVMYKITSAAGGWVMLDTSRTTYNVTDKYLLANAADAEGTFNSIDILSNGFKVRNSDPSNNPNGGTVIYMAFAEVPTKLALAR